MEFPLTVEDFATIKVPFQIGKIYPYRSVYVSSIGETRYIFKQCTGRKIRRRKDKFFSYVCFEGIGENPACERRSLECFGWECVSLINGVEVLDEARADTLATYEDLESRRQYWLTKRYKNEWDRRDCQTGAAELDRIIKNRLNEYESNYKIEMPVLPATPEVDISANAIKFEPGEFYVSQNGRNLYEVFGHKGKTSPRVYFFRVGGNREFDYAFFKDSDGSSMGWSKCEIIDGVEVCSSHGLRADRKGVAPKTTRDTDVNGRSAAVVGWNGSRQASVARKSSVIYSQSTSGLFGLDKLWSNVKKLFGFA